jgi:hypothetical protein
MRVRTAIIVALGAAAMSAPLVAPTTAAAATIRFNTTNQAIPLLLIHGFNDNCGTAFNTPGYMQDKTTRVPGSNSDARSYLASQYTNIGEVGYYTKTANNTDNRDVTGGWCSENLNSDPNPDLAQCNAVSTDSSQYGTKDDHLDRLSCLLAWYIYDNYTQYGEPVNVLAHSMGGLLTRYALGATGAGATHFPPKLLWVNNVVTVATPHGGVGGVYHTVASWNGSTNGVELDMMDPGNSTYSFMTTIGAYQHPQGYLGTRWALIGASDAFNLFGDGGNVVSYFASPAAPFSYDDGDGVVSNTSQMAMTADFKVEYGVHNGGGNPTEVAAWNTQYEHETGFGCYVVVIACFNGPYYLNDSSTAQTKAWTCSGCSGNPGGSPVAVSRSLATIAAQLQQKPVPDLPTYDLVLRSNANRDYVTAELNYAGADQAMLRAGSATKGLQESWTQVKLPTGHWVIRSNANGLYVSAELGYAGASYGELRARTDASVIGPYEVFDFIPNADGTYSIRSVANGLYVSAELGYSGASYGELRARSAGIGAWEEFLASTAPAGCVNYGTSTITGPDSCAGTFSKHSIWFSGAPLGFRGRELWTWANGTVQDSTATYQLSGLSSRYVVEIDAFIPNYHSNARHVHYHLCAPGNGCTENYLDQSPYYDQWAVVGYVCTTDGTTTVTVADNGGDRYPAQIAADAIRGVRTTFVC